MVKKFFLLLLISFPVFVLQAQYTEIINSNKPGFSESPYSVGTGVYQFETNLFYRKADAIPTYSNPQAFGLNLHFRTSFFLEKLELNLNTSLQRDRVTFKNIFESSYDQTGLGEFTFGAKYLVFIPTYKDKSKEIRSWKKRHKYDLNRLIPHIGIYAGVNFGSLLNDYHKRGGTTPKLGILLQNEFTNQFNVVTNVYYNYMGSDYPEWSYIVTGTMNFNDRWSGFVEHQALFNPIESQSNLGGGAAYLFNRDLQINASLRATFQEGTTGVYSSLGLSYRIDSHRDRFVEIDDFGNKIEPQEKATYNKGFFGRLFDKIGSIFKKKDKSAPQIENETDKKEEDTGRRKRQKSVLDDIIKDDKKDKKKTTREKERAAKKAKRAEEKAKRKLEKEKLKEEKRKKKEQEKLEKEIKQLEDELKDEEKEQPKKAEDKEKKSSEEKSNNEEEKLEKEIKKLEEDLKKEEEGEKKEQAKPEKTKEEKEQEKLEKEIKQLEEELKKEEKDEKKKNNEDEKTKDD